MGGFRRIKKAWHPDRYCAFCIENDLLLLLEISVVSLWNQIIRHVILNPLFQ